jgi:hypothetical protein
VEATSPARVARKPGHPGERDISRKTIARGMPGVSGVTVVTNACAFYTPHAAAGASSAPAFPAPSDFQWAMSCTTRAHRAAGLRRRGLSWLFEN